MKAPAPISMSVAKRKPPKKEVIPPTKVVAPQARAPERIVQRIVRDEALERRVATLEAGTDKEIIVRVEAPKRPRITKIKIKYSVFGAPEELIPTYSE